MTPHALRRAARISLAVVWLGEGLGLKLWLRDPGELAIVEASGLWIGSPLSTLLAIGVLEAAAGVVLLVGYRERLAVAVTTAAMALITLGVVWSDPTTLLAPLTGVLKNSTVAVCGAVVWSLVPCRLGAARARLDVSRRLHLLHALDAHRAALADRLDALPPSVVHAAPAPGAWSLAQLAEHLRLIDAGLRLDGPPASVWARATSGVRSLGVRAVLALPLRIPAPPSARGILPSTAARWPEVRDRWAALRAGWAERHAEADGRAVAFLHPLAGPFVLDDALAFLLAHHRHHDAQVRRTLRGTEQAEQVDAVGLPHSA